MGRVCRDYRSPSRGKGQLILSDLNATETLASVTVHGDKLSVQRVSSKPPTSCKLVQSPGLLGRFFYEMLALCWAL